MKTLFIHAKSSVDVKIPDALLAKLPKQKYGLVTNIQHMQKLRDVQAQIKDSVYGGQVVGCRPDAGLAIENKVDAFLFVGNGVFHPIQVAIKTNKDVWLWDPTQQTLKILDPKAVESYKNKKRTSFKKFLNAKTVGILVSTKVGQNDNKIANYSKELKMKKALELKARTDKKYYLFAFDTLLQYDLENFNFIDLWVNTACNRIGDENPKILEIDDLLEFEKTGGI
ncbi:MAG: diphthamide synthesis protein [Nanoarchaeota archaeon]